MKKTKHPENMTASELAKATKAFNLPNAFSKGRKMTPKERRQERALRRAK